MGGSFRQQLPDPLGNLVPLAEQLPGRKLGNHSSEDLVAEGRQHLLLVVLAQPGVDSVDVVDLWVEEHPNGQFDVLHVSVGSLCVYFVLSGLHIVDDGLLDEGDQEVDAFPVHLGGELAGEFVELDRVVADIN